MWSPSGREASINSLPQFDPENPRHYRLQYNCGPVALKFHADSWSRAKLLIGPFGTGKTSSAAWDIIMQQSDGVLPYPDGIKRSRFVVVRNTRDQLKDTTMPSVMSEWFPPSQFGRFMETTRTYTIRYEDRVIILLFRALDLEKDVRNLLSMQLTGAWIEEAREIKETIFRGILGRVGRFPPVKDFNGKSPFLRPPQVVLTTNYPSIHHWLYRDFVKAPIPGYAIYEQSQEENKHNLRPGYYEDLERDYRNRPDLLRTLVRGNWGVTVVGKEVYKTEWDSKRHISNVPLLPSIHAALKQVGGTVVRCWDNTGLSPACVLTFLTASGQWQIFREFYGQDVGIKEFGKEVVEWCSVELPPITRYRDIGDPAGKIRDSNKMSPARYLLEEFGITIEDGIQTFKVRRESVASRLNEMRNGQPAMLVCPSCTLTIEGFEGGYAYPETSIPGMFGKEPIKNRYSHGQDAIQYGASRLFVMRLVESQEQQQRTDELRTAQLLRKECPGVNI